MKTMEGCIALAAAKMSLIVFSDSPDHLLRTVLGVTASNTDLLSAAN